MTILTHQLVDDLVEVALPLHPWNLFLDQTGMAELLKC